MKVVNVLEFVIILISCLKHINTVFFFRKCISHDFPASVLFFTLTSKFPKGRFVALCFILI